MPPVFTYPEEETVRAEHAAHLVRLLGPDDATERLPEASTVQQWVDAKIVALGLKRPRPLDPENDVSSEAFLYWLLRMAEHTYRRLVQPPPAVDPALLARLEALLAARPAEDPSHAQFHVDAASSLRRAAVVRRLLDRAPGPVLALGDDDALSIALLLMDVPEVFAIDIDESLLGFLDEAARSIGKRLVGHRVDLFDDPVPESLRECFSIVVTDPPRSYEECFAFLSFGRACQRNQGPSLLLWADHPEWNFDHAAVRAVLPELGSTLVEVIPDLHAYPLSPAWMPDAETKARELGVEPSWLEALFRNTIAWTHLHVLASTP